MQLHGAIYQRFDLIAVGDVGPQNRLRIEFQFAGERFEPVHTTRTENDLCAQAGEVARGFCAMTATAAGDDDDFAVDVFAHNFLYFDARFANTSLNTGSAEKTFGQPA